MVKDRHAQEKTLCVWEGGGNFLLEDVENSQSILLKSSD